MTIAIWSDFACPYCYIGETRLEKAIEELGMKDDVRIDYRAFQLDPEAPKVPATRTPERFAEKYRLPLEKAAELLREKLVAPIYIHPLDAPYLGDPHLNLSANYGRPITVPHYEELYDGETIRLKHNSGFYLNVIHTPGHTPGSVTFWSPEESAAFVGDLIYEHQPGLTHFPGGNHAELGKSIVNKIFTLPNETVLLSGHSSPITVGQEKQIVYRPQ